jgi:phosphoesterase family protein/Ig-like domain-containing protein/immunoglobulin I-set domain protein
MTWALYFTPQANAYGGGISGRSGKTTSTCSSCHSGGVVPTVTLTGPASVASGSTNTYTLQITGGQAASGGLDVASSAGTFSILDPQTRLLSGEVTHNAPKPADANGAVTWTFSWTAPTVTTNTAATLYAAGLSTDDNGSTSGDAVKTVTLAITVTTSGSVAPAVTTQPANQTVSAGQTASFSVVASGTAPLTYQWRKNGTAITGATAASYTTPATVTGDNGALFSVVVTNSAGSATSNNATLTVNAPPPTAPAITTQPASTTVTVGQTASFSVVASGTAPLTYQWRKNGTAIAGATSASYTTPATVTGDNGALFSVVVTNSAGSATSNNATLTVNAAPVAPAITTQPANQTVTVGQTAAFTVVASGTTPLTYQWRKNGTAITGAIAASYTTPATVTTDSGALFSVVVTNSVSSVTSNNATLTVNAPTPVAPSITTQPASQTVTVGQTASFSVVASGTAPLTYQWRRNGTAITGATAASYTIPATVIGDNGALFSVVVTNSIGNATSGNATLTVSAAPTVPLSNHVFLLVEENHSYSNVIGSPLMPYLNALANRYGLATQYYANTHPSIPNYFMLTTGQTVSSDEMQTPATLPVSADNIVRQLMISGKTWKSYSEDMPSAGYTGGDTASYMVSHNPFAYFTDVANSSTQKLNLVPFSQFATDLASNQLPNFSYLRPNMMNDGHNGTLDGMDMWLRTNIAPLLASATFQQDGLLIITFDESDDADVAHGGGHVATLVISPKAISGAKPATVYQHESVLRTMLLALGISNFPGAASTTAPMAEFFSGTANTTPPPLPPPGTPATAPFMMTAPPNATAVAGQPVQLMFSIVPNNGFNGPVTLGCSGLPANATCAWSANPVTPWNGAVNSTLTLTVSPSIARLSTSPRGQTRHLFALGVPLFGIVFGSVLLGGRKSRALSLMLVALLTLTLSLAFVGCGSTSTGPKTVAQSFTLTVQATSGSTTVSTSVPVTVK